MRSRTLVLVMGVIVMQLPCGAGDRLRSLELQKVDLGGEIGHRIDATIENNLLVIDLDGDFLRPFRERKAKDGYVGLGKTIDALVRFAAYSEDPRVVEKKKQVVDEIIRLQEPDGYIGFFVPDARVWSLWDIHEMSYLIYGLTTDYRFFNETSSLEAARKAADYIIDRWSAEPDREPSGGEITVYMAVTGLENALLALHGASGDDKYLDFCTNFRKLAEWDGPIVKGRWGQIQGHAYAYLCRSIAQLRLYRLWPDDALLRTTRRAMDFLLQGEGLAITGTCGQHECWHDTQEGAANLGETCATAYMIRWWDELMRMEGDSLYGDLMERATYNALFGAQSPDGRRIRYYTPFEGERAYFDGDTYCCPCNYRRIIAELPQIVAYTMEDGIAVNLYTDAKLEFTTKEDVRIALEMDTAYPSDGNVRLRVNPDRAAPFALRLRIPRWCTAARVVVNGEVLPGPAVRAGDWYEVRRTWSPGDIVEAELPMSLRLVKGRQAQAGRVAVMCGPRVFCLSRTRNPVLEKEDLRLVTIDPATLSGPFPDDSVRPGGLMCKVKAWKTTNWYPMTGHDWELTLTEFPDPGGEMTYFHVPNPEDEAFVSDELLIGG